MGQLMNQDLAHWLIQASYLVAAGLFIFGLKRMSHPSTARGGVVWAGKACRPCIDTCRAPWRAHC